MTSFFQSGHMQAGSLSAPRLRRRGGRYHDHGRRFHRGDKHERGDGQRCPRLRRARFGHRLHGARDRFAAGQGVGNVADFVRNAGEIVTGYSEAMGTTSAPSLYVPVAIAVGIVLVAGAALGGAFMRATSNSAVAALLPSR